MFKRTTGTRDIAEARRIRDAVFQELGFDLPQEDAARRSVEKSMGGNDFYFEAIGSVSGTYDELIAISETIDEYAQDARNAKDRDKFNAQRDALVRKAHEQVSTPYEMAGVPHKYGLTLREAKTKYEAEMAERHMPQKTVAKLSLATKRYMEYAGGNPRLEDISRPRVKHFIRHLRGAGQSASTTSNDLSFLAQAFAFAQDEGFLVSSIANPFRGHRLTGFEKATETERFTTEQVCLLLAGCKSDLELSALIYLGYYTGMRLDEIHTAQLIQIESAYVWDVATEGGKTASATRKVPVNSELKTALQQLDFWPTVNQRVAWKSLTSDALGKRFGRLKKRVLKELTVDDKPYMFHSFRHGFVTQLMEAGYTELKVADLSGHSKSKAATEAGKTYFKPQLLLKLTAMIEAITQLPTPAELGLIVDIS